MLHIGMVRVEALSLQGETKSLATHHLQTVGFAQMELPGPRETQRALCLQLNDKTGDFAQGNHC